jgi:hypothetical protein
MSQQPPDNSEPEQPDVDSKRQADSSTHQNSVEGNQNRVVQGEDNKAVLGDGNTVVQGNNNLLVTIKELILGQQLAPVGNPAREHNQRLLLADIKQEVVSRLKQSLHNAVLINLGKESQPQQVKRPWDAEIKIGLKPAEPLPDTTTILSVFDSTEIAGKLLILGAPGAGKTTTQLELAQALVVRAEEQPEYPVPVLFNLSSWKDDRQPLTDWLVAELKSKYGVSKNLGQKWVDNRQLLPLLDGLDELETQRQELCVQAIDQFLAGENRPLYLVVCSRIEEYSKYSSNLHLNGAIYLRELNETQISEYFEAVGRVKFWQTLQQDETLLNLMITPLFLSITVLSAQELSVEDWQQLETMEARIEHLFDAYWEQQMFKREHSKEFYTVKKTFHYLLDKYIRRLPVESDNERYIQQKLPTPEQTRHWLVWLAQQMQQESKIEFLIEEMQPDLLENEVQKITYDLTVSGFIGSMISGLTTGMMSGFIREFFDLYHKQDGLELHLIKHLIYGLIIGLVTVLIIKGIENIQLINSQKFVRTRNIKFFTNGLVFGLINWLLYVLADGLANNGLGNGLFWGLLFGLVSGISYGLIGDEIKTVEKIKFSVKTYSEGVITGMVLGIIFGVILGVILAVYLWVTLGEGIYLIYGVILGVIIGVICGMIFGLIIGFIYGIDGQEIENKTFPNQGIYQSAINTIIITSIICIPVAPLMFFIRLWFIKPANGLSPTSELSFIYPLVFGVFLGLFIAIPKSGTPAIKHLVLRVILWSNGYIPWNYARFLDYCTERLFLQRVGGRYRFIHKLLQDHFAQMEFKRD